MKRRVMIFPFLVAFVSMFAALSAYSQTPEMPWSPPEQQQQPQGPYTPVQQPPPQSPPQSPPQEPNRPGGGEFLQFQPPTECFARFFGPAATPVGQPSCAKKIVRFKLDEVNMNLQQAAQILDAAKDAAKLAGFDLVEGTQIDLTEKMRDEADRREREVASHFADQGVGFEVVKALLTRGSDQTIEGALYQTWRFEGAMRTTKGDRSFNDVVDIKIALSVADPNTTRILDQTMSFGGGGNSLQGVIVSNTASSAPVSLNLNFEMNNDGGDQMFECADPNNPQTCTNKFSHSFEQTIALAQTFNAEGKDVLKIQWTESGEGGGPPPPPDQLFRPEGGQPGTPPMGPPPGGSFNNTMTGGSDETGAGCLEMKQDIDATFRADSRYAGAGGAYCGPFADGSDKCESYKQGRQYSSILKVEDAGNRMFGGCDAATGQCGVSGPIQGDLPPEFQHLEGAPPPNQGFNCGNTTVTNSCDGQCPDGVPQTPPDPQNAANNTPIQAWLMGCFEGLMFDDSGVQAGFGNSARKAECWDASGLVATSSDNYDFTRRDARIDTRFDRRDNFDDDRRVDFQRPANLCQMHFDNARNVEVIDSTGKDHCVPDHFSSNNSAATGTPLCSQAGPPSC